MSQPIAAYGPLHRVLHWTTAALIVLILPLGIFISDIDDDATKMRMYAWHEWFGLTVFVLTGLRLVWRVANPVPPDPTLNRWERTIAQLVHIALYALLITMPILGHAANSAFGFDLYWYGLVHVPRIAPEDQELGKWLIGVHMTLGWSLAALFALHVLGVVYHVVVKRDAVLARMAGRP